MCGLGMMASDVTMRMMRPRTAWGGRTGCRSVCALAATFAVACAFAAAQQPSSESTKVPDRATWVRLDCMTSGCHAKLAVQQFVHAPVSQGACDSCHEAADEAKHTFELVGEGAESCFECHEDLGDALEESDTYLSRHFPVAEGDCLSCHDPHASKLAGLLSSSYRERRYGRFDEDQFELCFQCHDAELVTEPETDETTKFRNGEVNLHHLHTGADGKGRNCKTCHTPHMSRQARLVREGVMFKKWKMPLQYLPTKTGGYCGPACHSARSYDRIQAVSREKPARPPK